VSSEAERFAKAAVRRSRQGMADALGGQFAPAIKLSTGNGDEQLSAQSVAVAVERMERGEGPDRSDPEGEAAFKLALRVAK
jgi:hypothetical protein